MKMIRSALIVASFTVLSRLTGYFRDMLMAKFIGAGVIMDALAIAIKVPSFLRRIFAEGALNSSFIPIFSSLLVDSEEKAKKFLNDILSIMLFILITVIIVFEIFMPNILTYIMKNSDPFFIETTIFFSRITFPFILLISLTALFSGVLNSFEKFEAAASSQIGGNCFIIMMMLIIDPTKIAEGSNVAAAITGSGIVQLLWVFVPCYIYGIKPRLNVVTLSPQIKQFSKRMIPAAFGAGVLQLNLLVDMYIAILLPKGTNSYLYYAERLYHLPISITGTAMGTVLLPLLTRLWRENKPDEASYYQNRSIEFTFFLSLPAMLCLYFLSETLVRISFERGEFTNLATTAVTETVMGFTIGLPAYILAKVFNSSFFSRQNTLIPTLVAIGAMLVNLFLNILLMDSLKHVGIALSTSIASWFNVIVLGFLLKKRGDFNVDKRLVLFLLKCLLSFVFSFCVFALSKPFLQNFLNAMDFFNVLFGLLISFFIISGSYGLLMWLQKGINFNDYLKDHNNV